VGGGPENGVGGVGGWVVWSVGFFLLGGCLLGLLGREYLGGVRF